MDLMILISRMLHQVYVRKPLQPEMTSAPHKKILYSNKGKRVGKNIDLKWCPGEEERYVPSYRSPFPI
jgi:hypothetical protein